LAVLGVVVLTAGVVGGVVVGSQVLGHPATVVAAIAGPVLAGAGAGRQAPTAASADPTGNATAPTGSGTAPTGSGTAPTGSATAPTGSATGGFAGGVTAADRSAGLLKAVVPQHLGGQLTVVPGASPAPGPGPVKRVRVEVEAGLPVDGAAFATFVLQTLNDPRSWGHGGRMTFARTSGAYDIRVVLASPVTAARLCLPLQTQGTLSCGTGNTAVLTMYRWVKATPEFGPDRTEYRRYVVNHEVGHTLGHGHEMCPGPGKVAPVMMQQTKGLKGCLPNGWPFP
jgi:hypothetical protein